MIDLLLPFLLAFSPSPSTAAADPDLKPQEAAAEPAQPAAAAAPSGQGITLAVYEPFGALSEAPSEFDFNLFSFDQPKPTSLFDLTRAFAAIREDDRVPAVVFDLKDADLGFSQIQSLRREFQALRDAGKQVHVYLDYVDFGSLLLGSAATRLVVMPEADVMMHGFYVEDLFFKGLLDKVGVQADIIHIGDYKAAGESFTRTQPSEESRQQNEALFDSLYQQILNTLVQARKLDRARLQALIDKGYVKPSDLKEAGLVDEVAYRTDFVKGLRTHYGRKAEISYDHGIGGEEAPAFDLGSLGLGSLFNLGSMGGASSPKAASKQPAVGVVVFEGVVDADTVTPARIEILKAAKTKSVKALVLRVNSPGGSALESEILWEATRRFQAAKKPLIVSMGDVAASGGYYMAAGADAIFAEPGTLTGSIGVVGGKLVIKGLLDWAGISTFAYQRGRHASALSSVSLFNEEQRALVKKSMEDVYAVFKERVQDGRGDRLQGELEALAGGRVYTGEQALKLGLVDRIGGLSEAIAYAAEQARVEDYEVRILPETKGFKEILESLLGTAPSSGDDFIRLAAGPRRKAPLAWLSPRAMEPLKQALASLEPRLASATDAFLRQAECLRREQVLLAVPPRLIRFK